MSNNIREYRNKLKYTLRDLSKMTNLSVSYLSRLERGFRNNPSLKTMIKICNALNCTLVEIFN